MNGVVRRLPVKGKDGSIDLIEIDGIFYLEAKGHDTLIRTKRKKPYHSVQRIQELAKKLPAPAFVRCHREYIVNLNRVRCLPPRESKDYDLRLDPPVNRRIPIARDRLIKNSQNPRCLTALGPVNPYQTKASSVKYSQLL